MAESAFLHIQDRESGPIRVVEIPWILVRIGRAAFCEVRLTGPDLEPEICRLQRRGRTWYLVPTAPSLGIQLGYQTVQAPCPLPLDVPFRVGDHTFVLRKDHSSEAIWGDYRTPEGSTSRASAAREPLSANVSKAEARPEAPAVERVPSPPPRVPAAPFAEPTPAPAPARPTPTSDNPWEARWRAAAARLKKDANDDLGRRPSAYRAPERYPSVPLKEGQEPAAPSASPAHRPAWASPSWAETPSPRPPGFTPVRPASARPAAHPGPRIDAQEIPRVPSWERPVGPAFLDVTPTADRDPARPPAVDDTPPLEGLAPPPEPQPPASDAVEAIESPPFDTTVEPREPELPDPVEAIVEEFPVTVLEDEVLTEAEVPAEAAELVAEVVAAAPSSGETSEVVAIVEPGDEVPVTLGTVVDEQRPDDHAAWVQYYAGEPTAAAAPATSEAPAPALDLPGVEPVALLIVACENAAGVSVRQDLLPPPGLGEPFGAHSVDLVTPGPSPVDPRAERKVSFAGEAPPSGGSSASSPRAEETASRPAGDPAAEAAARSGVRSATLLGAGVAADTRRDWADAPRPDADPWAGSRTRDRRSATAWDLPSAQEILSGVGRRPPTPAAPPPKPATWDRYVATVAREPDQWRPPAWLAWPPAALLVLAIGLGATYLTTRWARDSYNATVVHQRLLALGTNGARNKPLPEGVEPPRGSWWATTPNHLTQWSHYLGRSRDGEQRPEEARELLDAAVGIAPLHPAARLARAGLNGGADEPDQLARSLGLSRDAVSLGWCAGELRRKGKSEAALKVYREALEIACRVEDVPGEELGFGDDRYLLPGESQSMAILRLLTRDESWDFKDWSAAVPSGSVAELAAARVLRERGKPDSEPLLDRLATSAVAEAEEGQAPAIRLAVKAEACALLARWKDAEQAYRRAIDGAVDPTARRSWWFNLANVESRLDDQRQRDLALHAALETSAADDISRRVLDVQRGGAPRARLRPGGRSAN